MARVLNYARKENEKITWICIKGNDITEKKKNQQEREFDRENLKALINNTGDLIWSVDRNFELITFNDSFSRYFKKPLGKPTHTGMTLMAPNL